LSFVNQKKKERGEKREKRRRPLRNPFLAKGGKKKKAADMGSAPFRKGKKKGRRGGEEHKNRRNGIFSLPFSSRKEEKRKKVSAIACSPGGRKRKGKSEPLLPKRERGKEGGKKNVFVPFLFMGGRKEKERSKIINAEKPLVFIEKEKEKGRKGNAVAPFHLFLEGRRKKRRGGGGKGGGGSILIRHKMKRGKKRKICVSTPLGGGGTPTTAYKGRRARALAPPKNKGEGKTRSMSP